MLSLIAVSLLNQFVVSGPQRADPYVWQTADILGRGVDRTYVAAGTHRGNIYRFKATGVCKWDTVPVYFVGHHRGPIRPPAEKRSSIFGIDFKVQFGGEERRVLDVGTNIPEQNAIDFVADRDDVPIRIFDNWDLPKGVSCSIDSIEVVNAPPPG